MTDSWPIRRTHPVGFTLGTAIPVFINNMGYYLSTVDAYGDGAIDVWGFLDRPLFRKRVAGGWVATAPPPGSRISVHNLGSATVIDGNWRRTPRDIVDQVEEAIRRLNPAGKDLLDLQGSDVELRGKVRYTKLGFPDTKPCLPGSSILVGEQVPIFRRAEASFALERWFVFADGSSRIGTVEPLQDLQAVLARVASGELCASVPDGAVVRLGDLGSFRAGAGHWFVDVEERCREVVDLLAQAQGAPSSVRRCMEVFEAFTKEPTEANRQRLRAAYEAVPEHLRMYCGDMDTKDEPILEALSEGEPGLGE